MMQISMSSAEFAYAATSWLLQAHFVLLELHFVNFKAIYEVLVMPWTCFYQRTPIWSNWSHVACKGEALELSTSGGEIPGMCMKRVVNQKSGW